MEEDLLFFNFSIIIIVVSCLFEYTFVFFLIVQQIVRSGCTLTESALLQFVNN